MQISSRIPGLNQVAFKAVSPSANSGGNNLVATTDAVDLSRGLLSLRTPTRMEKVWNAAKMAATGFCALALPAAGAALAGPIGVAAAMAVNAGLAYLQDGKVTSSLLIGALTGLAGLPALAGTLGVAIMGGMAVINAVMVGKKSLRDQDGPQMLLDHGALAKTLSKKVNDELKSKGVAGVEFVERPTRISEAKWEKVCCNSIAQSFDLAAQHLGVAGAMGLLSDVSKQLMTKSDARHLNETHPIGFVNSQHEMPEPEANGATLVNCLFSPYGPAFASGTRVVLDQGYFKDKSQAMTDLVIGHELSHLHNKDQATHLGKSALLEAIEQQGKSWANSRTWTVEDVDLAEKALFRDFETRCDSDGVNYALKKGHQPDEIARAAEQLFAGEDDRTLLATHPASSDRVQAIRSQVKAL